MTPRPRRRPEPQHFDLQVKVTTANPEQSKKILKALVRLMTPDLPKLAAELGLGPKPPTPEERAAWIAKKKAEILAEYP